LVVTTRKDLVKLHLAQIAGVDLLAVEVEIQIFTEEMAVRELLLQAANRPA
jgi:tetraacyldisaccharide-1-P 4'-kinase